ncbi:MAG: hypothetical protein AAGF97_09375, partial [Planctomycetota bacterium]
MMRRTIFFGLVSAIACVVHGASIDLIQQPLGGRGQGYGSSGGGVTEACRECIFDTDPATYWEVRAQRTTWPGDMSASANARRTFGRP